jgi:hypothetical protein
MAAEQGFDIAQYNLGVMYSHGEGIKQDHMEAYKLYVKSASQGYAPAKRNLGSMFYNGNGVPINDQKAYEYTFQAAKQGDALAIFNMGVFYDDGSAVDKDMIKSYGHFFLLTTYENDQQEKAVKKIGELKLQVSPTQIKSGEQEARKLVREYGIE